MKPKVGAIILNWNTKYMTSVCANILLRSKYENFELAIVDNGSTDGSVDYLVGKFGRKIKVIKNEKNLGYSLGFNRGIKYFVDKGFDYTMVLNSDAFLSYESIGALVDVFREKTDAGFVSGKVYRFDDPNRLLSVGLNYNWLTLTGKIVGANEIDNGQYENVKEFAFIDDVFMLMDCKMLKQVGFYDGDFFIQFEEADLICRGKSLGYKAYYTPNAKAWHRISISTGGTDSPLRYFYSFRNRIIFLYKNQTNLLFILFFLWNLIYLIPKTVFLFMSRKNIPVSRSIIAGSLDGIKHILKD
tara:strand:- start:860 stop:1759 length:900 start_codon:yes stop_codon:yes gene_type:complete